MTVVTIDVRSPRWKTLLKPYTKTVRAVCEAALADVGFGKKDKLSLTVVLANDAFMRQLNRDFRGRDKPTNVLSFPADLPESRIPNPEPYLGDIVLALETIEREAKEQGKSARHHTMHLLVHGTLHLLGHDHMRKDEAANMEQKEIKILKELGVENPYL